MKRIHRRLGTAGFVLSIVALVAALGGGAYAASGGLTGKQKKEVEKIAKKYAGKPGATGATGPAGTAGAKGENGTPGPSGAAGVGSEGKQGPQGDAGPEGKQGAAGTNGKSPSVVSLAPGDNPKCPEGGAKITGAVNPGTEEAFACNGSGGSGGGYTATLPSGESEYGYWETLGESGVVLASFTISGISFPLPLATPPAETVYITGGIATPEEEEKCPGNVNSPKAKEGILCIYEGTENVSLLTAVPSTFGARLYFPKTEVGNGSWAVTAE